MFFMPKFSSLYISLVLISRKNNLTLLKISCSYVFFPFKERFVWFWDNNLIIVVLFFKNLLWLLIEIQKICLNH